MIVFEGFLRKLDTHKDTNVNHDTFKYEQNAEERKHELIPAAQTDSHQTAFRSNCSRPNGVGKSVTKLISGDCNLTAHIGEVCYRCHNRHGYYSLTGAGRADEQKE